MTDSAHPNDGPFLDWCLANARTELSLFSRRSLMRLYALAGHRLSGNLPAYVTARAPIVEPLVAMARAR